MSYMLLILEDGEQRRNRPPDARRLAYDRMMQFRDDLKSRGIYQSSDALAPDGEGVRIQVRAGKPVLRDGPFSEAKEIVGGYFVIACETQDEAVAIARQCPAAEWATVEVRRVAPCHDGAI
ncbi:MAG: YciI family protein [Panacagrimonas sp.]